MKSMIIEKARAAAFPVLTTAMVVVPTFLSHASDASAPSDVNLQTITTEALTSMKGDMLFVIAAAAGVSISLVGITVGLSFLFKQLKGLKSKVA